MTTTHTIIDSPIGELTLVAVNGTLSGLYFAGHWTRPDPATFGERSDRGFEQVEGSSPSTSRARAPRSRSPLSPVGDGFQRRSGVSSSRFHMARRRPTAPSRGSSATPPWPAQSGVLSATTRSRWSSRATASSERTASSPATPAASSASGSCSTSRARLRHASARHLRSSELAEVQMDRGALGSVGVSRGRVRR